MTVFNVFDDVVDDPLSRHEVPLVNTETVWGSVVLQARQQLVPHPVCVRVAIGYEGMVSVDL